MKLLNHIVGAIAVAIGLTNVAAWAANNELLNKDSGATRDTIKIQKQNERDQSDTGSPICGGE